MGGGGGEEAEAAALGAAGRLLGLRGRTARGEANGDGAAAEDDDDDAEEEEETTSLESSLSSDGREDFADALATRTDLRRSARGLRGLRRDREGGITSEGCGLDETATPAASIFLLLERADRKKRRKRKTSLFSGFWFLCLRCREEGSRFSRREERGGKPRGNTGKRRQGKKMLFGNEEAKK